MQEPGLSLTIANHVATTGYEAVPPEALAGARRALLDALGVMLAATGISPDTAAYRPLSGEHGTGHCRVFGSPIPASPASAAFANGALAHALDFGDCFDAGPAHPHAAVIPALLALADSRPAITMGELLVALAIGGDLACRFSLAPARAFEEGGWYPPPLVNLVSSAAACARLLRLSRGQTVAAMSFALLSGSFPAALKYDRESPLRGTREAFVARAAVEAALLAEAGAAGFSDPLGGPGGFFDIYAGGCQPTVLLDKLGERYLGAHVSFKPWPSCRGTHAYIEAALQLRRRASVDRIERVIAGTGPIQEMLAKPLPSGPQPLSATAAKFSIPYTVSVAFADGKVDLGSFDEAHLRDERIRRFAAKVESVAVPGWTREHAASGRLAIVLTDGARHDVEIAEALGAPQRPLSDDALVAKFVSCSRVASCPLSTARSEELAQVILSGAPDRSVSSLLDLLTTHPEEVR